VTEKRDDDALVEEVVTAYRERSVFGEIRPSPAFYDLDEEGRLRAFEEANRARAMEAALDPQGLSTTAHALLAKIRGGR
jgi:hypothetical protein